MSSLIEVTIGSLGRTITGKTPLSASPEDFGNDVMFITPSDSFDNRFISYTARYLSLQGANKLGTKKLPKNSVLVSCIGSAMGKVSMNKSIAISNQQINSIIINQSFDAHYIYYKLRNSYKLFRNSAMGSTALPMLNKTEFDKLSIIVHSEKKQQQQIASVLSALDDKIELNNKINDSLEAMAKTLYDYWFVQFDFPNAEGKPYKSSGGEMVYDEVLKREIPKGWEVKSLKEFSKTGSGGTPLRSKKEYFENGNIPWINSGEVNESFITSAKKHITHLGLQNSSAKLFPKRTILMAMYGATAGQVSLLDIEACTNQAICGIMPLDNRLVTYVKLGLNQLYQYLINLSTGSARDNLSQDKIKELNFVIPSEEIIEQFHNLSESYLNKTLNNLKQNQGLASLRDWLLPMLMNGQVKVVDAYKEVEGKLGMVAEEEVKYGKINS